MHVQNIYLNSNLWAEMMVAVMAAKWVALTVVPMAVPLVLMAAMLAALLAALNIIKIVKFVASFNFLMDCFWKNLFL